MSRAEDFSKLKKKGKTIKVGKERILVLPMGVSGKSTRPIDPDLEAYLESIRKPEPDPQIEYYPDMDAFDYLTEDDII